MYNFPHSAPNMSVCVSASHSQPVARLKWATTTIRIWKLWWCWMLMIIIIRCVDRYVLIPVGLIKPWVRKWREDTWRRFLFFCEQKKEEEDDNNDDFDDRLSRHRYANFKIIFQRHLSCVIYFYFSFYIPSLCEYWSALLFFASSLLFIMRC